MAEFNRSENEAMVGTGLSNASRGTPTNQAYGTLFEGIGKALQVGLNTYDTVASQKIEIQADQMVNKDVEDHMPPDLEAGLKSLEDLAVARQQGAYSDTQFYNALYTTSKRLRSQYPDGYGPQIEAAISAAQGRSTANDLRKSRLADIDTATKSISEDHKNMREWTETAENQAYLQSATVKVMFKERTGKTMEEFLMDPDPELFKHAKYVVGEARATKTDLEALKLRIEQQGVVRNHEGEKIIGQYFKEAFNENVNLKFGEFVKYKASAEASNGIDAEESKEILKQWNSLQFGFKDGLYKFIMEN